MLTVLLLALGLAQGLHAAPQRAPRLTENQTRLRAGQYERAEHWALKALVLLSLGRDWHPCGGEIVLDGLRSRDPHLRAYALETLARTSPLAIPAVVDAEIIDHLIRVELRARSEIVRQRATLVLRCVFPSAGASGSAQWDRFWREREGTYTPAPWKAPKVELDGKSVAEAPFQRALDLYEAGLEVAICVDSTGSMQPTIDAAAEAVGDLVSILGAVAPDLRIGLVHYKDYADLSRGAAVLAPLSRRTDRVHSRLARLEAGGGGDTPECVEEGLRTALDRRRMGWRRDSNKLIVVVGDAPPHERSVDRCVELAQAAYERPFGARVGDPSAPRPVGLSAAAPTRPFVTATIGVGRRAVTEATRASFSRIAGAGGGAYTEITAKGDARRRGDEIVGRVLELAFGRRFKAQIAVFVEVYFRFERAGAFR